MSELLWIDIETTGLDPEWHVPVEIAVMCGGAVYTSVMGAAVPAGPTPCMDVMSMHRKSGLWDELLRDDMSCDQVDDEIVAWLDDDTTYRLAGFGPHFDLAFVREHMPKFAERLDYRVFDVRTIERFLGVPHAKTTAHRAVADMRRACDRCAYLWRNHV